jgi:hypothetical protein
MTPGQIRKKHNRAEMKNFLAKTGNEFLISAAYLCNMAAGLFSSVPALAKCRNETIYSGRQKHIKSNVQ